MRFLYKFLTTLLFVSASSTLSYAQGDHLTKPDYSVNINSFNVNIYKIEEVVTLVPEESITADGVAKLLAPALISFTEKTNQESCAYFCKGNNPSRVGAIVTTMKSSFICPIVKACPYGMTSFNGLSIHSHPKNGNYKTNLNDKNIVKMFSENNNSRRINSILSTRFSETDYKNAGYMISLEDYSLKFQNGFGTDRLVEVLSAERRNLVVAKTVKE